MQILRYLRPTWMIAILYLLFLALISYEAKSNMAITAKCY